MRRTGVVLVLFAISFAVPGVAAGVTDRAAPSTLPNWAEPQIRAVVAAGLLAPSVAEYRPDDPLTRGELYEALTALTLPTRTPADPARLVTIRELDAQLVAALDLVPASRAIRLGTNAAGLSPPDLVGTETVARLLGLRVNHPQGQEVLERLPGQPASRAEAAYSLARLLALDEWHKQSLLELTASFALPQLTDLQREVLDRAMRFVGYPYVWAGLSERRQQLYYGEAPGGFDCSGFVWRIYKLEPFAGAPFLGELIRGRTTYSMAAEMLKADRLPLVALQPGDLVFFGAKGVKSAPQDVGHMGIYVGAGWFVHSSGNGVTLQPLQGWYLERFAWGRRPLSEAGLA